MFSIGIEEEYLLIDPQTRALAVRQPDGFMQRCKNVLADRVSHEYLQSQVEIGTGVCESVAQARSELQELREAVSFAASEFDMQLMAASSHPWSHWSEQEPVDMERYRVLGAENAGIMRRMAICGMHIHAGIEDCDQRIDLMNQVSYFLPHLLALSTSSPFWEGRETGLKAFRPTMMGDLPRTGLPERFDSWNDWIEMIDDLERTGMVDDPSMIWWDLRPSVRHPTLEVRVCDICTWLDDCLCIAAIYQSLLVFLDRLRQRNQRWRQYRRILIAQNKWRAQRYGIDAELGDYGRREAVTFADLVEELIEMLGPHAADLDCVDELEHARTIVKRGTSSDRQLKLYHDSLESGASEREAHIAVVDWLVEQTMNPRSEGPESGR